MINPKDDRLKAAESSKPIQKLQSKDRFKEKDEKVSKLNKVTIREVE